VKNSNDGAFFVEDTDFKKAFNYYQITHIHDDWMHSYYEVINDDGTKKTFNFNLPST
jgi:hypothetical protein